MQGTTAARRLWHNQWVDRVGRVVIAGAGALFVANLVRAVADIPTRGASYQRQRKVAEATDGDLVDTLVQTHVEDVFRGRAPERPYVLVAQQSLFDPTRAPEGKQTLWGYCHVPNGSTEDMTARIEDQIERFAPDLRTLAGRLGVAVPACLQAASTSTESS